MPINSWSHLVRTAVIAAIVTCAVEVLFYRADLAAIRECRHGGGDLQCQQLGGLERSRRLVLDLD